MAVEREWRPGEFVRYLAGNCDSERLIERFDESALVRNAIEYLERRSKWDVPFIDGIRHLKEIPHPDISPLERIDVGMKQMRGDKWGMLLEAKWLDKGRGPGAYAREVYADVYRLASLKTDLSPGTYRYMLIAGPQHYFEQFMAYEGVKALLHTPALGRIRFARAKKVRTEALAKKYPKLVACAQKRFKEQPLPATLKTMLDGRSTSAIGETRNDSPVHVRLWRVIPWDEEQTFKAEIVPDEIVVDGDFQELPPE